MMNNTEEHKIEVEITNKNENSNNKKDHSTTNHQPISEMSSASASSECKSETNRRNAAAACSRTASL